MKRFRLGPILLAGILLSSLPASADFTLDIFGNANLDDTIDERDVEYVQGIINGTNDATDLSDANYDGKVDQDDITQIELIIRGEENNLTIVQYIKPSTATETAREPVTVKLPIKSIAALSGTYGPEMLCVLGDADKIAAVTDSAKTRGEIADFIKDKPVVGSTFEWDIEKILQIKPDVVLAYASYDFSEQRKALEDAGITLVQMNFHKPETYAGETRNLGWLLGRREKVEELIDFETQHLELIEERLKGLKEDETPRVYAESYKDYQYGSTGSVSLAIDPCGGTDIFSDLNGTVDIDPESVISKNPDVVIKMTFNTYVPESGYNAANSTQMAEKVEDIMNRTGWSSINAVRDGKVYIISSDASSIHPSIFNSYVAKWLHPELFEDMDPVAVHEEWLQKFLGIDYKGVYAYPLT